MGQPARLEENFVIEPKSSIEMAPGGSCPRRSPRRNPPPIDSVEDKLARNPSSVRGPNSGSTSSALSRNPTPGPDLVPALILVLIPAPTPAPVASDELFKKFMKAYLETNQGPKQPEREQNLKAKVPEVYYGKSHMDCYHFCQQCEDHFETVGATGFNRTLFAAFFLRRNISVRWAQFKRRNRGEELTPITWTEFKAFLRKNLGESKSFVDSIWKKLKTDSQYQLEEVYNRASHLKHLQSILLEYDPFAVPTEVTIVRYFEEGLKPSIKAEMDQDNSQLVDYEELVAKVVRAKAKAGLRPSSYVQETDLWCLRGNRPAHTTAHKVQTQGAVNHGDDSKASKGPASTPTSAFTQDYESPDKARRDKKKKQYKDKRNSKKLRDSSIPATGVNKAEVGGRKKKDISKITYYNYNKKGYFAIKCPESRKS